MMVYVNVGVRENVVRYPGEPVQNGSHRDDACDEFSGSLSLFPKRFGGVLHLRVAT
jgi:hypothetical protein